MVEWAALIIGLLLGSAFGFAACIAWVRSYTKER